MKSVGGYIGWFVGMVIGAITEVSALVLIAAVVCCFIGRAIGGSIDEDNERQKRADFEAQQRRCQEERAKKRKAERKAKAQSLARKYPEATKYYFKLHWGIIKYSISDYDITDDKVEKLLSHEYSYERDERTYNTAYKAKIEAQEKEKREAERREAERKRRERELVALRKEQERRNLVNSIPSCVSNWNSSSNSTLKHKYFYEYYPYSMYKDNANSSMWEAWKTVWHFKNDPSKGISSSEYNSALQKVINLVESILRSTFGSKTEYLTLVCLTASTQTKTDLRFKKFANTVCSDLNMANAYDHIRVTCDGSAKHEGGTGVGGKSYDRYYFSDKYVILFDDVRTSGRSIENERRILEGFGAKVVCAITIAQTRH